MWWFFNFQSIILPILNLTHIAGPVRLNVIGAQLFLLGIVPGTNFQITFADIVFIVWAILFAVLVSKLYIRAQKILFKINLISFLTSGINNLKLIKP